MTGVPDRKDVLNQACKPQMHVFILGCISLGKILILILKPKTDFLFLWQNPKKDYESNESVFLIQNFCVSLGKDSKNVHLLSGLNTKASN